MLHEYVKHAAAAAARFTGSAPSRIAAVLISVVAVLAPAQVAAAAPDYDGIYPNDRYRPKCADLGGNPTSAATVCLTDNSDLWYYADSSGFGKLEDLDKLKLGEMLYNQYDPTDLKVQYDYSPVFSGGGETDIVYQEDSKDLDGAIGVAWCNDRVNGNDWRCDQTYVRIKGHGYYQENGVTCHETGHVVGLLHGFNTDPEIHYQDSRLGCMVTGMMPPGSLGSNNRQFINEVY
ncbi:hypothetical protein ABZ897_37815 [Nonomuraea sp. NPDC046802]|uniref:hypothetical protein n=1 Tax=Nonomuraea sp. NPDC046802 TaxID=3154919 RepID=UPI0033F56DA9